MAERMKGRIAAIINEHKFVQDPIAVAQMILREMREPTIPMLSSIPFKDDIDHGDARIIWQSMIDAALAEAPV